MIAAANKFLRIYYARVKEFMDSLETESSHDTDDISESTATEIIDATVSAQTNPAESCEQDSAMQECNASGSQGFVKQMRIAGNSS